MRYPARRVLGALLLLVAMLPSTGVVAADSLHEVEVIRDLPYVAGWNAPDRQRLDLYLPRGEGPWPVLMWIHGGAWAVGHRRQEAAIASRFAERGIAVAAIDHRMSKALWINEKLAEGIEHPQHVKDCATAFAWLRDQAELRNFDLERMFVGGFSSGAHLSALLATDPKYLRAHHLETSAIRGALPVGGAYDIPAYYEMHLKANGEEMAERHVLDVFGRREGALVDASPVTHMRSTKVPMLVLSERDTHGYTTVFEDAVKAAGIERIRFLHLLDRRHATIGKMMARAEPDEARDAMIAFIRDPEAAEVAPNGR